jgi:hypothetical protein
VVTVDDESEDEGEADVCTDLSDEGGESDLQPLSLTPHSDDLLSPGGATVIGNPVQACPSPATSPGGFSHFVRYVNFCNHKNVQKNQKWFFN